MNQQTLSAFIWSVADLLHGSYEESDYGKVMSARKTFQLDEISRTQLQRIFKRASNWQVASGRWPHREAPSSNNSVTGMAAFAGSVRS